MSMVQNFASFVDMTLFQSSLAVVMSAVRVLTSKG
jgi:hypothetical protein